MRNTLFLLLVDYKVTGINCWHCHSENVPPHPAALTPSTLPQTPQFTALLWLDPCLGFRLLWLSKCYSQVSHVFSTLISFPVQFLFLFSFNLTAVYSACLLLLASITHSTPNSSSNVFKTLIRTLSTSGVPRCILGGKSCPGRPRVMHPALIQEVSSVSPSEASLWPLCAGAPSFLNSIQSSFLMPRVSEDTFGLLHIWLTVGWREDSRLKPFSFKTRKAMLRWLLLSNIAAEGFSLPYFCFFANNLLFFSLEAWRVFPFSLVFWDFTKMCFTVGLFLSTVPGHLVGLSVWKLTHLNSGK